MHYPYSAVFSIQRENVQTLLAFSTLKCWSTANRAIDQEDVLLIQLCSTSWSKQQSDALLIFKKIDQSSELKMAGSKSELSPNQSCDLRGVFLWQSTCLHARWSHCPYTAAVPEVGIRQKGREWSIVFSICSSMAQGKLENLQLHFSFLLEHSPNLCSQNLFYSSFIHIPCCGQRLFS